ncbi:phytanoyl-CoA dioxygenase family protein [Streptomyces griseoloalbus]|uniref:Phytanoyl-CoA dioxygenase family protein n=1 Tax=Streptomyces griseoloalbus TaxID=67303 RepID=A0ABV3E1E9_9ACTN
MDFIKVDDPGIGKRLRRDGVVLIDGLLDPEEVAETRAQMLRYQHEVLPGVPRAHYEFHEDGVLRNMTEMQRYDPWFRKFGTRERFTKLFRGAVEWEPTLFYLETFPKRSGCRPLRMHQELFATPMEPAQYLHLWIALDDVTNDNSGMVFYRGSHKLGLAPHVYHSDQLPAVEDELLERLAPYRIEPDFPAGSAALFDGCTIHGSKANVTDGMRLSLVVAVRGVDTVISGDDDIFSSVISRFFREELGIEKCSVDDTLAELGGDETVVRRVLGRIERDYDVRLPEEEFGTSASPRMLANRLIELTGWDSLNSATA